MKLFTIPNIITLLNLLCGMLGILYVFNEQLEMASYMILVALVLDFLDGFLARKLNSYSDIGKQLDSLADMVSFGVLPSFMLYYLIPMDGWVKFLTFLPAMASALRLAKFNIDERQGTVFYGIPTPANAMVVASFPFIALENIGEDLIIYLSLYAIAISFMMLLDKPMIAFKFKDFSWSNNKPRYSVIAVSVLLLVILKLAALPFILLAYMAGSFYFKEDI